MCPCFGKIDHSSTSTIARLRSSGVQDRTASARKPYAAAFFVDSEARSNRKLSCGQEIFECLFSLARANPNRDLTAPLSMRAWHWRKPPWTSPGVPLQSSSAQALQSALHIENAGARRKLSRSNKTVTGTAVVQSAVNDQICHQASKFGITCHKIRQDQTWSVHLVRASHPHQGLKLSSDQFP